MSVIKFSDANKLKYDTLKKAGITVSNYIFNNRVIYTVSIKDMPNVDDYIDNRFNSVNDILKAFSDMLVKYNYIVMAA